MTYTRIYKIMLLKFSSIHIFPLKAVMRGDDKIL